MTYLARIPNVLYDFTLKTEKQKIIEIIPDIMTRVSTFTDLESMMKLTDTYLVLNQETPDIVAYKLYGDMQLHWVILYFNKITDLQSQWPQNDEVVKQYAIEKYGESNLFSTHHYQTTDGYVGDLSWIEARDGVGNYVQVSNYDHELALNEQKRVIRVLRPVYVADFVKKIEEQLT